MECMMYGYNYFFKNPITGEWVKAAWFSFYCDAEKFADKECADDLEWKIEPATKEEDL